MRRLETQLGLRLIERGGHRFELTPAGRLLYQQSLEVYGQIARLSARLAELEERVRGSVRLTMASGMPDEFLNGLLHDFHQTHPEVVLQVAVASSAQAERSVLNKTSTAALSYLHWRKPELTYEEVYRVRFGHFCGPRHPLFGRSGLSLEEIADRDFVSLQTNRLLDREWPSELARMRRELRCRVVAQTFSLGEAKRMIRAGLGIGMLPLHSAIEEERQGRLWRLPPYVDPPEASIVLITNPDASPTRAEALMIAALRARIAALAPAERLLPPAGQG